MVLAPAPTKVAVICFGTGATARAASALAPSPIDIIDVNPDVFRCAGETSPDNLALLERAHLHVDDGRTFLLRSSERFDVITQEPMPPHFAGVSALYSREYYAIARQRLAADGVMVQWLPLHLTAPADARAIAAAALEVFPESWLALAPNDQTGLLVMSPSAIPEQRRRAATERLGTVFVLDPPHLRAFAAGEAPVTDDRPALEYNGVDRVLGIFKSPTELQRHNLARVDAAASAPLSLGPPVGR
jgi:spermidine synthase